MSDGGKKSFDPDKTMQMSVDSDRGMTDRLASLRASIRASKTKREDGSDDDTALAADDLQSTSVMSREEISEAVDVDAELPMADVGSDLGEDLEDDDDAPATMVQQVGTDISDEPIPERAQRLDEPETGGSSFDLEDADLPVARVPATEADLPALKANQSSTAGLPGAGGSRDDLPALKASPASTAGLPKTVSSTDDLPAVKATQTSTAGLPGASRSHDDLPAVKATQSSTAGLPGAGGSHDNLPALKSGKLSTAGLPSPKTKKIDAVDADLPVAKETSRMDAVAVDGLRNQAADDDSPWTDEEGAERFPVGPTVVQPMPREGVNGTPLYMSPEQIRGGDLNGATDVYALGVMLFELLEGRPPYDGESVEEVLLKHQDAPVPDQSSEFTPDEIRTLVARMLSKDPDERPSTAEIIETLQNHTAIGGPDVHGLEEDSWRVDEIGEASNAAAASVAEEEQKKKGIPIVPIVLLLIVLLAVVAVVAMSGGDEEVREPAVATPAADDDEAPGEVVADEPIEAAVAEPAEPDPVEPEVAAEADAGQPELAAEDTQDEPADGAEDSDGFEFGAGSDQDETATPEEPPTEVAAQAEKPAEKKPAPKKRRKKKKKKQQLRELRLDL